MVRGINAGARELPRSELDALTELAKQHGAKGLVWAFVQDGERSPAWRSPIAKFLTAGGDRRRQRAARGLARRPAADRRRPSAGRGRRCSARCASSWPGASSWSRPGRHDLLLDRPVPDVRLAARRSSAGTPSTIPSPPRPPPAGEPGRVERPRRPGALLSRSYDLVLDGNEIGGGSIRNHRPDVQEQIFELIGIDAEEAQARFGFLLDALRFGAPPHGGIAFGLDRLVALLAGRDNIRESIAFPKATSGADPLTGAPGAGRRRAAARARAAADGERAMDALAFEHHLTSPQGQGHRARRRLTAHAGGSACCDEVAFSVTRRRRAGHRRRLRRPTAAGRPPPPASAAVTLVRGADVLDAARIGPAEIAERARRPEPGQAPRRRAGRRRAGPGARAPRSRAERAAAGRVRAGPWWR